MKLSRILLRRYRFRNVHEPAPELTAPIAKQDKAYANLPERYLVRKTAKIVHKSEDHPAYVPRLNKWQAQHHGLERPWTEHYWKDNPAFDEKRHPDIVQPICEEDWMWFRGDRVEILTGHDKGKQGFIIRVVQERNWVFVENLNCEEKWKIEGDSPGIVVRNPQPLLVTRDIKLVDPENEKACDVEWQYTEDGERVRVSNASGRSLPIPTQAQETVDYKTAETYKENKDKDTPKKLATEVTFRPKLATFEMDIMEKMNIKEERVPKRTFWY